MTKFRYAEVKKIGGGVVRRINLTGRGDSSVERFERGILMAMSSDYIVDVDVYSEKELPTGDVVETQS